MEHQHHQRRVLIAAFAVVLLCAQYCVLLLALDNEADEEEDGNLAMVNESDVISLQRTISEMTSTFVTSVQQQSSTQEISSSAVVSELPADHSEVSLPVAINSLHASINRFINVFEKAMSTLGDETSATSARRSQAVQLVQEADDGLSAMEKGHLIAQFMEKPTMVEAYLALTNPKIRRLWIHNNLTSRSGGVFM